uniref:Pectate lyase domain-containing protein n=1 Tax=Setaria viridis TaxID=4556 RepID=A0A4V6D7V9_SETVI|nr:hypothetical protein SEVIR_4G031900v2 [Setaria viridis]
MAGSAVVSVSILLFVLLATAAATPTDVAIDEAYAHLVNVTGDQEHWAERAEVARAYNRAAYMSDPVAVMDRFEDGGVRTDEAATCWRWCRGDWARDDRKRLARCAIGFGGHKANGGLAGEFYVVTDPTDDPASLLSNELIVTSDKTLDGRAAQITLQHVSNVILHNPPHPRREAAPGGAVIRDGARPPLPRPRRQRRRRHGRVMLFGGSDDSPRDKIMQATVAFNHFVKGLVQRMPRCLYGFSHVANTDYTHWQMYAIGGNKNRHQPGQPREHATYSEYKDWVWKSQGDLFLNGAFFNPSGGQNERRFEKLDLIQAKSGQYAESLTKFAGALNCRVVKKC